MQALHDDGVDVALFPELSLSGYAIDDLLLQDVLLDAVDQAVVDLARATAKLRPVVVVGAPIRSGARLYNCAVVLHRGEVLGVVPKVCKAHFTFPFRIQGVLGRDWLMISRGSGGPQSIPTYAEILG